MNTKNVLLSALFAISATQSVLPASDHQNESEKGWKAVCKAYATSLLSGGTIGSITGAFSAYAISKSLASTQLLTQHKNIDASRTNFVFGIIIPIAVLITEHQMRSRLVDEIKQSFNENDINYKRNFVTDAAWIASWVTFLSSPLFNQNVKS